MVLTNIQWYVLLQRNLFWIYFWKSSVYAKLYRCNSCRSTFTFYGLEINLLFAIPNILLTFFFFFGTQLELTKVARC